ncbi:GET complex subunit get1 [Tieghemiomyces parasiticus]|uniref:GET complex subunit get1 n=1 Tax=Tieghemiomyces parasiticus TaxID=78921 RepID=A0A9W8DSD4_9FUNG|nr:GET complex subunit get1 [Tieghemiomyces parasiticus]
MYLLLFILALSFVTELCHSIGYSNLVTQLWHLYRQSRFSKEVRAQQKLKQDIIRLQNELRQTTAQDEFAKWAKIKRRLDKDMAAYDAQTSDAAFAKSAFEIKVTIALRILLYGSRTFVVFWYRSAPVFFLPSRWFNPIGWFLSFPLAPAGK